MAPKKRRRSRAASSSEEEESSVASEDADSDEAHSDTQESGFSSGSAGHRKRHRAERKKTTGSSAEAIGKQDEEDFMKALTKFWEGQGTTGRKMLAKYQPFESIRLASGMPPFSAYQFWAAVMALGGHNVVSSPA